MQVASGSGPHNRAWPERRAGFRAGTAFWKKIHPTRNGTPWPGPVVGR